MRLFKRIIAFVKSRINNVKVRTYLKKNIYSKGSSSKIKIAFIVQMPEVWDKQRTVYEKMKENESIDVKLLVVPAFDFEKDIVCEYGTEREYFKSRYGDITEAVSSDGKVIDLKACGFDYIFYQRPYDRYLPKELRSSEVVKYAKICYIPYAYIGAGVFNNNALTGFFRNVYMGFMDSDEECQRLNKTFSGSVKKGYQQFLNLGYPVLEKFIEMPKRDTVKNVLWTPRWSYADSIGGSHFVEYKDEILSLDSKFNGLNIVVRPHPLTFSNMVKEGKMTEEEVASYKKKIDESSVSLDKNKMIEDTFRDTDVLITDYSSIMVMFFLTGRPMIFCHSNLELNTMYKKMLEGIYVAKNWSDIEKYMECIKNGNDYLKEKREEIIRTEFANIKGSTDNIIKYIIEDYNK